MSATAAPSRLRSPHLIPAAVLSVLSVVAIGAFVTTRGLVEAQETRLLQERSDEVGALLTTSVASIEASLGTLAGVAASSDPGAAKLFREAATPLIRGGTTAVGIAAARDGGFVAGTAVGDSPAEGQPMSPERGSLFGRALAQGRLVADLVPDDRGTRLVLALPLATGSGALYQESFLNPSQAVPSTADSPFRNLRMALYAASTPEPSRLVLTTESIVPLTGRVERRPFAVGADSWLLAVGPRTPLVGSFGRNVPWLFLAGGLLTALLGGLVAATLSRRRAYALDLVGKRTGELEEALGELRETEAFIDRLLRALPVLVTRISVPDHRLTYASPNVERLLGIGRAEALTPQFLAGHIHPDDLACVQHSLGRVVADATTVSFECRFQRGDRSYGWMSLVAVPDEDERGRVTGIFGYGLDVDDRRRAEEAQQEAQAAAETANRAKSEFLSRMSHELRTPLNAVLGFGQLLGLEDLTPEQRESVDQIIKGGRHLLALINEVLDISRIEAGELALSPEPLLASALIQDSVDLIRPLADQRGIQLVVSHRQIDDCYVFADHQRAKQVLLNLLSNAVKYNRSRGTVAVSCELRGETRVRIGVSDTGHGIPAERLGLLFAPFERLGAEDSEVEGTGIGLALSLRLAQAMDGTVDVTSTLGQGSTFTLDLPRVEGPVERYDRLNGGVHYAPQPSTRRHRVLHIEDNLSNLKLVERILERRGDVELIPAMHGGLGVELAREHHPALILLDLHLPDVGGEQVLQRLREDEATASIPVIIVSADATTRQTQRLLAAGATGYLTKPIDVVQLLRTLDEVLQASVPA